MIAQIRLQNWTSFGAMQTAPLAPITAIVGANNSGKSNFLRFPETFRQTWPIAALHRPSFGDGTMKLGVECTLDGRRLLWDLTATVDNAPNAIESMSIDGAPAFRATSEPSSLVVAAGAVNDRIDAPRSLLLYHLPNLRQRLPQETVLSTQALANYFQTSRLVHLKADAIRAPNSLTPNATIYSDGSQLAAVIAQWTLEFPEVLAEFTDIFRRCLPEMKRIFTRSPAQGQVKLIFEQTDGEQFEANAVSDGVVLFAALIAHALEAPPHSLVMIEEPERGLHPRRLNELVDVLRTLVERRKTQFVMATHSPALLNVMRDEPEAILLFRRTASGTEIRQLSAVPELAETLTRADPGELLADGAFNEGFRGEGPNEAAAG